MGTRAMRGHSKSQRVKRGSNQTRENVAGSRGQKMEVQGQHQQF